jgi:hypothetical protein
MSGHKFGHPSEGQFPPEADFQHELPLPAMTRVTYLDGREAKTDVL